MVQADGSAWMAFNTLAMLGIAALLAERDDVYDDLLVTFLERFMMITRAVNNSGLYDAERGFFYDLVETPTGDERVQVETIGGAVPLFSAVTLRAPPEDERRIAIRRRLERILARERSNSAGRS